MSVLQVTRALALRPNDGWRYMIGNRTVCRSLDGCCVRGLSVDRTGMPGSYLVYAFTQTWFGFADGATFSMSFELGDRRLGDHTMIAAEVGPYLDDDRKARLVAFAAPDDPVYLSPRSWFLGVDLPPSDTMQIEYGMIRAWEGDEAFGLASWHGARERLRERPDEAFWNRRRDAVERLIACAEAGRAVRPVIEALNEEGRAMLRITPIRARKAPR